MEFHNLAILAIFLQLLALSSGLGPLPRESGNKCKPVPGDKEWPSPKEWQKLNSTLSGRLMTPPPPGGVCHPSQPTYNPAVCPQVATAWSQNVFHTTNPISNLLNNWNNDTCLPFPEAPCSGAGYPVYVINATCAKDVKKGIDFARDSGVRLIVKGTGHDYLGRSQAPNALSIWTYNIKGIEFFEKGKFKPKSCKKAKIDTAAFTVGAGTPMIEINAAAAALNHTIVSGGAATVGLGGFLTGGGHSAMSPFFGFAADNVLEMEVVTSEGDIVIANECENTDLFWAMRGGGGATFGVLTKATIRAFPSFRYASIYVLLGTPAYPGVDFTPFWNALTSLHSKLPGFIEDRIGMYGFFAPNVSTDQLEIPYPLPFSQVSGFKGVFNLPLIYPENTTASLTARVTTLMEEAKAAGGAALGVPWVSDVTPVEWDSFYANFLVTNGPQNGGDNIFISSRSLSATSLAGDPTALSTALQGASKSALVSTHLLFGPGTRDTSRIPGGSNSINPALRNSLYHMTLAVQFPPLNPPERDRQHQLLKGYTKSLSDLEPGAPSYLNEADPTEDRYQELFWGSNYSRLRKIKENLDKKDVFWCGSCVGGDAWKEKQGSDGKIRVCRT